ncbi:MAG: ACT domain-containing protein [Clostridia bacterium]|nr:ACT domain-containing protein [Clostridia bacterium]
MKIRQLTVFVENKVGYLSEITELFAKNNIDMKALSIADTKDFGILRLIVSDPEKALKALKDYGLLGTITEVIGVEIPNSAGELSKALSVLAKKGVNVEYLYAFLSGTIGSAFVVIKATDNLAAETVLKDAGFKEITGLS